VAIGAAVTRDDQLDALRTIAPFDRISDEGLLLLLDVAEFRSYAPGDSFQIGGMPPRLHIAVAGAVSNVAGSAVGPVIGLDGMFADIPSCAFLADPTCGACLISIDRVIFFTLARASPELVCGFLKIGPNGASRP
jgi:hypothetical protein